MSNGFAHTTSYVECVNNWLAEVFLHSCCSHGAQINTVKCCVTPEIRFVILLDVERLVVERSNMQISSRWKHFAARFQPLLRMQISFQHSFVVQHVSWDGKGSVRTFSDVQNECSDSPIGSEIIMSTFSGSSISSIFPAITWITLPLLFVSISFIACSAMLLASTA